MKNLKKPIKICLFGPSKKFLSGITYFTIRLANALNKKYDVCIVNLRNLLPKFLFPGHKRVGKELTKFNYSISIKIFDGVDWYWFPSIFNAIKFFKKENPDIIVLQWWTGTVAHTYLLFKILNKLFFKKKIIMEFHEVLDPGEQNTPFVGMYIKQISKLLFKNLDGYVCHSKHDKNLLEKKYNLHNILVVPFGSFDQYKKKIKIKKDPKICNLLFFGLIRPYKGVDYLIKAFNKIPENQISRYKLYIIGEAWENCNPEKEIEKSRYKDKIIFVNKYVSDEEANRFFNMADVVVLPYLRASQSGAAHIAVSYGLPVIVSEVGGLKESMKDYKGAFFVEPKNTDELKKAMLKAYKIRDKRFKNPHSWEKTVEEYGKILAK